jgi:predicted DNA-binding protein
MKRSREKPEFKRIYVPLGDAKLERLLAMSSATNRTIEQLIQEAIAKFLEERRGK